MPNSLNTTMRKWRAVMEALRRANRGRLRRTSEVRNHNAPTYEQVYGHFNNALRENHHNQTIGGTNAHAVRLYFIQRPARRNNIALAYNKLNTMARELAGVRRKAVATSTIQRHWRRSRQAVMNRRAATALRALSAFRGVPNTRRKIHTLAFPKPVYGPKNEWTTSMASRKYSTY